MKTILGGRFPSPAPGAAPPAKAKVARAAIEMAVAAKVGSSSMTAFWWLSERSGLRSMLMLHFKLFSPAQRGVV
jgi:hypothetical protein